MKEAVLAGAGACRLPCQAGGEAASCCTGGKQGEQGRGAGRGAELPGRRAACPEANPFGSPRSA